MSSHIKAVIAPQARACTRLQTSKLAGKNRKAGENKRNENKSQA